MSDINRYSAQDSFMIYVMKNKISVKFYLTENIQMKGKIKHFDVYSVIIENEETGNDNLIFKHAIIAIVPSVKISLEFAEQSAKHTPPPLN